MTTASAYVAGAMARPLGATLIGFNVAARRPATLPGLPPSTGNTHGRLVHNHTAGNKATTTAAADRRLRRRRQFAIFNKTRTVQTVATCRKSPYKPGTVKLPLLIYGFKFGSAFLY